MDGGDEDDFDDAAVLLIFGRGSGRSWQALRELTQTKRKVMLFAPA